jgi:hypothetical protein
MEKNILSIKPIRFSEAWKIIDGKPPFCKILVRGIKGAFELDETTSFIWLHADGTNTVETIITEICKNFEGAGRKRVTQGVTKIIKKLNMDDLINPDYNPLYPIKDIKSLKELEAKPRNLHEGRRKANK